MADRWRTWLVASAMAMATLTAATLAGCADRSDLTAQEAYDGVEERIRATAAAVFYNQLTALDKLEVPCEDWGRSPDYRLLHNYRIQRSWFAHNASLIADARDYWREAGYRITRERTTARGLARDVAAVDADGFSVRAWQNDHGDLYLSAVSPCLAPEPIDIEELLDRSTHDDQQRRRATPR